MPLDDTDDRAAENAGIGAVAENGLQVGARFQAKAHGQRLIRRLADFAQKWQGVCAWTG